MSKSGMKGSLLDQAKYQQKLDSTSHMDDFNPYDYIDQSMYKNNNRGRMSYQEDLGKLLYMAQINQENRMNEYNSPAEQAKRMREAGINPDLNGVENMPAQNVAGYQGNPLDGTQSNLQTATDVFGIISSVSSMATALMSGFSGISMNGVSKFANAVGAGESLFNLFDRAILSDGSDVSMFQDFLPPLSRSQKKSIERAFRSYSSSSRGKTSVNNALADYYRSIGEYNKESLNPFNSASEDVIAKVWQPYIDALEKHAVKKLNAESAEADYKSSYYTSEFGEDSRKFEVEQRDLFRQFKKPLADVFKNIDKIENSTLREVIKASLATLVLKFLPL